MAFDVPYVINGSKHSARLFRRQYQNSSGEGSGVTRAGDLRVEPLNVPGPGFRVAPGGATVQSRDTFASSRESYGPVNDQEIVVTGVPGTGSGETRRDLVILEITDPQMESVTYPEPTTPEGWQDGDNFCRITIIQDVDSLVPAAERPVRSLDQITTGAYANVSGVALAAITYPASTSTITASMVEDLRKVQSPKRDIHTRNYELTSGQESAITATSAYPAGATWPSHAEVDDAWARILIPEWATRMRVVMTWNGVLIPGGAATGWAWVQVGLNTNPDRVVTQGRRWNTQRDGWRATGTVAVPESMRGTVQGFFPRATRLSGTNSTAPVLDASSGLDLLVEFLQVAD